MSENGPSSGSPDRCYVDSTVEVQSPSSPCASHSSEASLFSIDSPPHPDSPTENSDVYGDLNSSNDDKAIDVDDVIDDMFNTVENHTDVHAHNGELHIKREHDAYKTSADCTELYDNDITRVVNLVNMKKGERNKNNYGLESNEERDEEDNVNTIASSSLIGAYIRLEIGSYKGRLARISSMSRCRARYSVSVLKYEGTRQLSKHTTINAGTQVLLEEDSYTASDVALIEQDKEYLKIREGAIAGMVQNKIFRSEEVQRIKIERAAAAAAAAAVIKPNALETTTAVVEEGEH